MGIVALMAIVFPYPLLGLAFVPFFAVEKGWIALKARLPAGKRGLPASAASDLTVR